MYLFIVFSNTFIFYFVLNFSVYEINFIYLRYAVKFDIRKV